MKTIASQLQFKNWNDNLCDLPLLTRQDTSQVSLTIKVVCGVGKCPQSGHIPCINQMVGKNASIYTS